METEREKRNREYAEQAYWTGHYHYLMQALAVAMSHTLVWRLVGSGTPFTLKELFDFAKQQDEEKELTGTQFYYVSREGAIGLSPGLEYLTQWLFIPMEPGKERDFFLRDMREKLQDEEAVERAIDKAVEEGLARERAQKAAQETKYRLYRNNQEYGPYTVSELLQYQLTANELVWAEGMPKWTKAGDVPELAAALNPAPVQPQVAPTPQPAPVMYYLLRNNQKYGPYTVAELLQYQLTPNSMVWAEGMAGWVKAYQVPELANALGTR